MDEIDEAFQLLEHTIITQHKEHLLEILEHLRDELDDDFEPGDYSSSEPEEEYFSVSPVEDIQFMVDEDGFHYLCD